ncbi:hypothetical protein ABIC21_002954 [Pseudarthrobacter sp. PvP090]
MRKPIPSRTPVTRSGATPVIWSYGMVVVKTPATRICTPSTPRRTTARIKKTAVNKAASKIARTRLITLGISALNGTTTADVVSKPRMTTPTRYGPGMRVRNVRSETSCPSFTPPSLPKAVRPSNQLTPSHTAGTVHRTSKNRRRIRPSTAARKPIPWRARFSSFAVGRCLDPIDCFVGEKNALGSSVAHPPSVRCHNAAGGRDLVHYVRGDNVAIVRN